MQSLPVKPSPNLPNDQAIALYASLCPFEGTSVSVGRGTTFPFQVIGSPYTNEYGFCFMPRPLKGSDMNPLHKNTYCYGKDLRDVCPPKGFSLAYVLEFYQLYQTNGKKFEKVLHPPSLVRPAHGHQSGKTRHYQRKERSRNTCGMASGTPKIQEDKGEIPALSASKIIFAFPHKFIGYVKVAIQIQPGTLVVQVRARLAFIKQVQCPYRTYIQTLGKLRRNHPDTVAHNDFLYFRRLYRVIRPILSAHIHNK